MCVLHGDAAAGGPKDHAPSLLTVLETRSPWNGRNSSELPHPWIWRSSCSKNGADCDRYSLFVVVRYVLWCALPDVSDKHCNSSYVVKVLRIWVTKLNSWMCSSVDGWGAASPKVAPRIPVPVRSLNCFSWPNPSSRTMGLKMSQPLTEYIFVILFYMRCVPLHSANCVKLIQWHVEECSVALSCN
jgi:hypothetical protein